jgi:serine/threonine protein phosphatase PrpC
VLSEAVIAVALVVLCVVGVMILFELRRGRVTLDPPRPSHGLPVTHEPIDDEITLLSRRPSKLPMIETGPESVEESTPSAAVTLFEEGTELEEPTGSKKMFLVWASGQTDRGKTRKRNEDSILLLNDHSLFVVADGMGGYAGGDVASRIACEAIEKCFRSGKVVGTPERGSNRPPSGNELVWALEAANEAIRAEARNHREYGQMGATIISARFVEKKQRAFIGHVGDSRCYRFRGGELRLLTTDHTMAAKGVPGPMGQHVRRALGVAPVIHVDLLVDRPRVDDIYLLCSDGLNKMVTDAEIARVLRDHGGNLDEATRILIDEANRSGGKDNVSVILVGIQPAGKKVA